MTDGIRVWPTSAQLPVPNDTGKNPLWTKLTFNAMVHSG